MMLYAFGLFLLLGFSNAQDPPTNASATTAPPPDSLSVVCTYQNMMVYLDRTEHSNLDMNSISLKDASCKLADIGKFNETHLSMRVPLDGCLTNHTTSEKTITYANSIIAETKANQGNILISREFQEEFPFKCTYPRSAILSVASFSPREKVIYTRTAEFGNFTFLMEMYPTAEYETPYDTYPVLKDLKDKMYLEVKVLSNDSMLVLFPDKCWATDSPDPEDDKSFAFIEDGCNEDDTLVYNYTESAVQQFSLEAFRFMGVNADAVVYLHCAVEACRKGDNSSRCAQGCVKDNSSKRRRRSLLQDSIGQEVVTVGPVYKKEVDEPAQEEQKSMDSLTIIAAVAGVLGVVVLALIVALAVMYKRHNTPQNAARAVYARTSSEDNKQLV